MNLTREEIENMPAGREMDALVWMSLNDQHPDLSMCRFVDGEYQPNSGYPFGHISPPRYSTGISAAWEVVEKLHLMVRPSILSGNWVAMKFERVYLSGKWEGVGEATADTAPLAICRAALLATLEK